MALILSIRSQVNRGEGGKGDIQPEVLSIFSEDELDLNEGNVFTFLLKNYLFNPQVSFYHNII